jgi:uncharacterized protein (UPF0264 family)
MISVTSEAEAREALLGGAEILDVKNPAEGSLGAQAPEVIRNIKMLSSGSVKVSAAIGDMPNLPGTAALAGLGAALCGADYIKVGLYGTKSKAEAVTLLQEVQKAVRDFDTSVVAAAYADFNRSGTLNPEYLPGIAASSGVQGCLLDTAVKDGLGLFDFLQPATIRLLVEQAHADGLMFGLAGALSEKNLPLARELGADVAGIRTAACRNHRRDGALDSRLVQKLLKASKQLPVASCRLPVSQNT